VLRNQGFDGLDFDHDAAADEQIDPERGLDPHTSELGGHLQLALDVQTREPQLCFEERFVRRLEQPGPDPRVNLVRRFDDNAHDLFVGILPGWSAVGGSGVLVLSHRNWTNEDTRRSQGIR